MKSLCIAHPDMKMITLRYFNPAGAHPSGLIGDCPTGNIKNLFPILADVVNGVLPCVKVLGNDYPTPDGTGISDYLHVCDLSKAHIAAIKKIAELSSP